MQSLPATSSTLYYDGSCPVCAREVAMYRRQAGADALRVLESAYRAFLAFRPVWRSRGARR